MRLKLLIPVVKPTNFSKPKQCLRSGCPGLRFTPRQEVKKNLVDGMYREVTAWRYECRTCGSTFRVYPEGVSGKQISQRVTGMAILLYLLGLSYGAVESALGSFGVVIGKSSVYRAVQVAIKKMPGLKKQGLSNRKYQTKAVGADVTSILCNGVWMPVGIVVDALNGLVITIDELPGQDTQQLKAWLEPILDAVDADVLVTDDADAFKTISDETGRSHQICKSHVVRNTETLVEELSTLVQAGADQSLQAIGVSPAQALRDLTALQEMIHTRLTEDQTCLEEMYLRYANAPRPGKGKKHAIAYRMRNLFMDRWNLWPRLTFYRTWKDDEQNELLDGTNNACERAIGWWIKERYRSMRGYKQGHSALGVSRLIALAGNNLAKGLRLADLVA